MNTSSSVKGTIVLLGGIFNASPKDKCMECIDFPSNDPNLTVYNNLLDIDRNTIYPIYLDNFKDDGSEIPLCTSCLYNSRNYESALVEGEYIGIHWFGFHGDIYNSSDLYFAQREWDDLGGAYYQINMV